MVSTSLRSVGMAVRRPSGTNPTNLLTQTFVNPETEAKYRLHRDATAVYNLLALPLALTWLAFFALATSPWYVLYVNSCERHFHISFDGT